MWIMILFLRVVIIAVVDGFAALSCVIIIV